MVKYTKKANSAASFACMRGVTDFTNAAQFNLYESGYAHLYVISMPEWINQFPDQDVKNMADTFKYILEYEFKGLDGIDDIGTEDNLNSYGNKRMPFAELCDAAEKKGKLLILTTNLSIDELTQRYGDRVVDRLIATTKAVPFTGDSLRK